MCLLMFETNELERHRTFNTFQGVWKIGTRSLSKTHGGVKPGCREPCASSSALYNAHRYTQVHTGTLHKYSQLAPPPLPSITRTPGYTTQTQSACNLLSALPSPCGTPDAAARPKSRGHWRIMLLPRHQTHFRPSFLEL